jgi:hypothetical protein
VEESFEECIENTDPSRNEAGGGRFCTAADAADEQPWLDCDIDDEEARIEDGGGIGSSADWSKGKAGLDCFASLRSTWIRRVREWNLVERMQAGFAKGSAGLLSDSEVGTVRADAIEFLRAKGIGAKHWAIRVVSSYPLCLYYSGLQPGKSADE